MELKMKKAVFVKCLMVAAGMASLWACTVLLDQSGFVMPNGVALSPQEVEMLEAMRPQVETIYRDVLGTKAQPLIDGQPVDFSTVEAEELEAAMRAYMLETIGPDYEKYVIQGTFDSSKAQIMADFGSYDVITGSDAVYAYRMICEARYWIWPWNTYNQGVTTTQRREVGDPEAFWASDNVQQIRAYIQDASTTPGLQTIGYGTNQAIKTGNAKSGFFPIPMDCYTQHEVWDPNITNQHAVSSANWYY